jgi:hypothetical protein
MTFPEAVLRFLLRLLGGWAILTAVVAVVNDLTMTYRTGAGLAFASLGKDWYLVSPGTLNALQAGIERHVHRLLWDPVMLTLLKAPAFVVLAGLGILLYGLGLWRRRVSVFAN